LRVDRRNSIIRRERRASDCTYQPSEGEAYRTSWECHGNSELELLAAQALRAGGFLVDSASNFCPRFGVPGHVSVGRFCADASLPNARFGV
jgi:hypothetical protein